MPREGKGPGSGRRRHRPAVLRSVPTSGSAEQSTIHIGHRMRACREAKGLTQEAAAAEAGITRNALGKIESRQFPNPTLQTMLALMQVYGLRSLEELLGPLPSYRLANDWQRSGWAGTRHAVEGRPPSV